MQEPRWLLTYASTRQPFHVVPAAAAETEGHGGGGSMTSRQLPLQSLSEGPAKRSPPPTLFGLITRGIRSVWFRTSACSSLEGCQFSHSCQMNWQCCTWNTRLSTLKSFVYKRRKYTYVFCRSMCRLLVIVLVWILFFFFCKIQSTQRHGTLLLRLLIKCQIAILQLFYILGYEIWSPFLHFSFSKSWLFNVRGSCSLLPPLFV